MEHELIYQKTILSLKEQLNIKKLVQDDVWIFGYGSLIWKADFYFDQCESGYVQGYVRRFWQASPDHRGTPQNLGRVCALVQSKIQFNQYNQYQNRCFGVLYRLPKNQAEQILEQLIVREKAGYEILKVKVQCSNDKLIDAITFTASEDNPYFIQKEQERQTAEIICYAQGSSGTNLEYFLNLLNALRTADVYDSYIERIWTFICDIKPEMNKHCSYSIKINKQRNYSIAVLLIIFVSYFLHYLKNVMIIWIKHIINEYIS